MLLTLYPDADGCGPEPVYCELVYPLGVGPAKFGDTEFGCVDILTIEV